MTRPHVLAAGLLAASLTFFLVGLTVGRLGQASDVLPGSPGDPLITRSYLEQYVTLNVVELGAGQRLIAEAGTEIVLRSGRATAIDGPKGGLSNVTAGRDLRMGEEIPLNHLLIVPRSDGRGVLATTDVFLMVRGLFTTE